MSADRAVHPRLLPPGGFAVVMATGILSVSVAQHGLFDLSLALVAVAGAAYVVLVGLAVADRLPALVADLRSVAAFGLLTFVAGTDVLAARAANADRYTLPLVLGAVACLAWLVLVPCALRAAARANRREQARGEWMNLVVATQSLAIVGAETPGAPAAARTAAHALWALGLAFYLLIAPFAGPRAWRRAEPDAWILPGALAISTLAAADLGERTAADVVWAVASAGYGVLLVIEARAIAKGWGARWTTQRWSTVFPLGMYATASDAVGHATLAAALLVPAGLAWTATAAATVRRLRRARLDPGDDPGRAAQRR